MLCMKKINIVHVITNLGIGGAETLLMEIVQHLDPKIFQQSVIYFYGGPHVEQLKELGIPAIQIRGLFFRYDLIFWVRLARIIKKIKPDGIHSLLWSANFAVRLISAWYKIPCVNGLHNNSKINGRFRQFLDRITGNLAGKYIAVSESVAQSATWIPAQKITVIPNCIDAPTVLIKGMHYKKTRYELELSDEQFLIGAVGRLHPLKRFDLLLESFARVNLQFPLSRLLIVGSGSEEKNLRKLARSLGVEQDFLLISGNPYGYYPLFDCFVLPSSSEGASMALLEACSFGLPCIVTSQEKDHMITSGHTGIIANATAADVAREIGNLIKNPEKRVFLGNNAYRMVTERFKLPIMIQHYTHIFSQLVDQN